MPDVNHYELYDGAPELDFITVQAATELATAAHRAVRQTRWDGSPYHFHLQRVAALAHQAGQRSTEAVVTALLHDIVEDTPITLRTIEERFGAKIAFNVELLTQRKGESRHDYFTRCFSVPDRLVHTIKFADRCDNVSGLHTVPASPHYTGHVERYVHEVETYFKPNGSLVDAGLRALLDRLTARAVAHLRGNAA